MKKLHLTLIIITLSILAFGTISVSAAETVNVSTVSELQSAHPYANNMETTWVYNYPTNAENLGVTFSTDTETEATYDFIYIYDGNNNQVGKYDGTNLSGATIVVPGNTVKIKLKSDGSQTRYGFRVTNIATNVSVVPNIVAKGTCGSSVNWELDSEEVLTISGSGSMYNYSEAPWYSNRNDIKHVKICDGVTSVGGSAFEKCTNLISIELPNSITSIGYSSFKSCSNLENITIPNSVTYINNDAFYNCSSLNSISIPEKTTSIGSATFFGCSNLKQIVVDKNNTNYMSEEGVLFNKSKSELHTYPSGKGDSTYTIPNGVTKISDYAFAGCGRLTDITFPNSITSIGYYSFYNCSRLTNLTIPNSVTKIAGYAFYGCNNLKSITLPFVGASRDANRTENAVFGYIFGSSSSYRSGTVKQCYKPATYNGGAIQYTYHYVYCYIPSSIQQVVITDATQIPYGAFDSCSSLTNISILGGTTLIESNSFNNCNNLTSVTLPNSVTCIESDAFYSCGNLTNITIPNSVTSISSRTFAWCSNLTSIIIPDNVSKIGNSAFSQCSNLTDVTLPHSMKIIEGEAFSGCNSLADVYYNGSTEEWNKIEIGSSNAPLLNAAKNFFLYVTLVDEKGDVLSCKKYDEHSIVEISEIQQKIGHSIYLYTDEFYKNEFPVLTPVTENVVLYICYKPNKYVAKFIDEDGTVIEEKLIDYDSVIVPPSNPIKQTSQQYTYTFAGWEGYYEGITQEATEMEFKATYDAIVNQYTYKFIDEKEVVIKEETVDYGSTIELPAYTPKANTQQYTYTFLGWDGYSEGMIVTDDILFTPKYQETINQYTYTFLDEDGTVLKEETVDYGTIITPPTNPIKTEYYLFDYWRGYTEGITLTDDITFTAVYKYKDYTITAEGLSGTITVTYNSNYMIDIQTKELYRFVGYFTEKDGAGIQITNEKGESLNTYNVVGDLKVYPYFYSNYMNTVELQGVETAMPGDTITQSAIFATDKDAMYIVATIKYPKHLNFKNIRGVDFKEATKDSEKVVGDYKYADITCVFDYEGNFAETNTNYIPFEIELDVDTDIPTDELNKAYVISAENVMLIGEDSYEITDIKNHTITILPKLAESIEIIGKDEIDATEQFSAVVSPDYTTDKSVVWSVDDETVATITQDGTVTPVKNGTVIITATAKDGSEVFATKSVNVIAYAKINSLDFGSGVVLTEFNPDVRKYTVYVKEDATSIYLTPTFSGGGVLRPNGSGVWVSGRSKDFDLNDTATTITLNRENVTDMTNSIYTVEVIKFEGTKTEVSEDKKSFTIAPINIENGKTVILALYNGEQFVEMQKAVYTGEAVPFTTTKSYTKAKVMVWDDITNLKPVCEVENIQ